MKIITEWNSLKEKIIICLQALKSKHTEELRQINLLFDANSQHYDYIDFAGLLQGLESSIRDKDISLQKAQEALTKKERELTTIQNELAMVKQELSKEKDWWDKWIADERINIEAFKGSHVDLPIKIFQQVGLTNLTITLSEFTRNDDNLARLSYNGNNILKGKQMIKTIAEWYKNPPRKRINFWGSRDECRQS
ncbi:MAG: Ribonuclease Y [Mycoplasmataceae bacterium]|nr:MAG: Ribonuclease Y [Mycoplasmataceae bacterium]